jgi:cytochrome c553
LSFLRQNPGMTGLGNKTRLEKKGDMMKKLLVTVSALAFGVAAGIAVAQAADVPPTWAWGFTTPPPSTPPAAAAPAAPAQLDNTKQYTVPGSKSTFTRAQIANRYGPADWYPDDHPPMPDVVAHGKESAQPTVYACGLCHYPNGKGRPENANITGLSYDYIVQQLNDFRNGARKTSDPRKTNTGLMASFTKSLTDDEIKTVAKYFSSIAYTPWIRVVESETAPKAKANGGMWITLEGAEAGTEPIGSRIIETPVNAEHTEMLRESRSGFSLCAAGQPQEGRGPGQDQ